MTELELAALHEGDAGVLRQVLARGVPLESVFAPDTDGLGCVHRAACRGDLAFLSALRAEGIGAAWLLGVDDLGITPLHVALVSRRTRFFDKLLDGLSPTERARALQARDVDGWGLLHMAAYADDFLGILRLNELMKDMPDGIQTLMTESKEGKTPVALAVEDGRHFALRGFAMVGVPEQTLWQTYVKHRNPPKPLADWGKFLSRSVDVSTPAGTGKFAGPSWVHRLRDVHRRSGAGPQVG